MSLVRFQSEAPGKCGSGSVVERHLAKVNVASSNLVFRSKNTKETRPKRCVAFVIRRHGQAVRQRSATPISPVRFRVAPPKKRALRKQCSFFQWNLEWNAPTVREIQSEIRLRRVDLFHFTLNFTICVKQIISHRAIARYFTESSSSIQHKFFKPLAYCFKKVYNYYDT